jgi:hypothetical protein
MALPAAARGMGLHPGGVADKSRNRSTDPWWVDVSGSRLSDSLRHVLFATFKGAHYPSVFLRLSAPCRGALPESSGGPPTGRPL